jgi:hypothetical protein
MTSVDVHAREARAERRWTKRGASLPARFQHWLARAFPWAWRVRLDLIILFNFASWLLFLALARIVAPALIARTPAFEPDFAVGVATTVSALAAIGFAVYWAVAVSRSSRLRDAARYAAQPGVLLASLVFVSFASWIVAARAAPYVDMLRHPLYGEPIEQSMLARLRSSEPTATGMAVVPLVRLSAEQHASKQVCMRRSSANNRQARRDAFLCDLAGKARRADLFRTILFDSRLEEWRADPQLSAYDQDGDLAELSFDTTPSDSMGEAIVRFASTTEPWKSRLASMQPWQRRADNLDDSALIAAFAKSDSFDRFIENDFLFGGPHVYSVVAFGRDFGNDFHQQELKELLATPVFTSMLNATERAFTGAAAPPAQFSAAEWDDLSQLRADAFLQSDAMGHPPARPLPSGALIAIASLEPAPAEQPPVLLDYWRRLEADPARHSAFVASAGYYAWKLTLLAGLVNKGVLAAEIRTLPRYAAFAEHWRRTLFRPAMGPEAGLANDFDGYVNVSLGMAWGAAILAALIVVGLNQVGLAATMGAIALNGAFAFVVFLLGGVISASSPHGANWYELWSFGAAGIAVMAPLTAVVAALVRRVRGRLTGFFAACAIGAVAIYAPISLLGFLLRWPAWKPPNDTLSVPATFAAVAFTVLALAWFITALLTRIARFPRAA